MSFKETILPDFVIADLYRASLSGKALPAEKSLENTPGKEAKILKSSSPAVSTEAGDEPKELRYKYLGKNQKRVSVIARYEDDPYIPEEHLQFLVKILSACKLNLGDVAILNDATSAIEIGKLKNELDPAFVLLFAIEPVQIGLPLSFPLLRPQSFDGSHYLTIPSIASLLEDTAVAKASKKQLWD